MGCCVVEGTLHFKSSIKEAATRNARVYADNTHTHTHTHTHTTVSRSDVLVFTHACIHLQIPMNTYHHRAMNRSLRSPRGASRVRVPEGTEGPEGLVVPRLPRPLPLLLPRPLPRPRRLPALRQWTPKKTRTMPRAMLVLYSRRHPRRALSALRGSGRGRTINRS